MEDFARQFADLLEAVATRVRSLTVDRVARLIRWTGLGIVVATLAFTALIFLSWAVYGALAIWLTPAGAFAVLAIPLVAAGGYLWFKRTRTSDT